MLTRKALDCFDEWERFQKNKALLVKGARQVGKSYLIKHFAEGRFENVVAFDLVENTATCESFRAATSAEDLALRLTIAADKPLIPDKTLVIIDEVQECPEIVTYIKYLVQQGRYRYILSGSLLGVKLKNITSQPVGYLTQVEMFPLDFEEFCWACGLAPEAFDMLKGAVHDRSPLPDFLYRRLRDLFHRYLLVGGMPDAVNAFVLENDINTVRTIHSNIRALYKADITKYAPEELRLILAQIYDLIPSQVTSRTRRFKISSLSDIKRFTQVQEHFLWLTEAGVALPVYNVTAPTSPLIASEQRNLFKLFYADTGMLMSSFPKSVSAGILDGEPSINMGATYEGFVAQELACHGHALRYFSSKKVGELDFLVEYGDGRIAAIEVKSGRAYRTHAALDNALATEGYTIDEALVLAETNIEQHGKICYLPVYCACLL